MPELDAALCPRTSGAAGRPGGPRAISVSSASAAIATTCATVAGSEPWTLLRSSTIPSSSVSVHNARTASMTGALVLDASEMDKCTCITPCPVRLVLVSGTAAVVHMGSVQLVTVAGPVLLAAGL